MIRTDTRPEVRRPVRSAHSERLYCVDRIEPELTRHNIPRVVLRGEPQGLLRPEDVGTMRVAPDGCLPSECWIG